MVNKNKLKKSMKISFFIKKNNLSMKKYMACTIAPKYGLCMQKKF